MRYERLGSFGQACSKLGQNGLRSYECTEADACRMAKVVKCEQIWQLSGVSNDNLVFTDTSLALGFITYLLGLYEHHAPSLGCITYRHARTWMGWPDRLDNWRDGAEPAQGAFAEVAASIARFEPVTVCANPEQVGNARTLLPESITVTPLAQDDAWFRDTGPTFVETEAGLAGIAWEFNGWGGDVIPSCQNDRQIASHILKNCSAARFVPGIVLEGGSIHVDGQGTLLTTEECLLHENRNPGHSKEEIEEVLKTCLGVGKIIWLPLGLVADEDTNGHIDNFACFAAPGHVLLSWPSTEDPEQLERSRLALEILEQATDAKGQKLKITKLFLPPPLYYTDADIQGLEVTNCERRSGQRLAASYVNFYICNGAVIAPAFGGPAAESDARAKQTLKEVFPDRAVLQISRARDILLGGGNIHCITQQQPEPESQGRVYLSVCKLLEMSDIL